MCRGHAGRAGSSPERPRNSRSRRVSAARWAVLTTARRLALAGTRRLRNVQFWGPLLSELKSSQRANVRFFGYENALYVSVTLLTREGGALVATATLCARKSEAE